jgi:pimeloyl-ACP methyl ester carboxylesterase
MGLETTPEIVLATVDAPGLDATAARDIASAIACPVLVIHGDADAIAPLAKGAELARLTHGDLHVLPGAGHEPELREADQTNQLIDDFLAATHRATT